MNKKQKTKNKKQKTKKKIKADENQTAADETNCTKHQIKTATTFDVSKRECKCRI